MMRTIPSAVLGEYMRDVQVFRDEGWEGVWTIRKTSPLYRNMHELGGNSLAQRYSLDLFRLVEAKSAETAKAKRQPRQRTDARYNDRKIRAELYAWRNERNRVNRGLRRIANDARVSYATVKRALTLWEADGQLTRKVYARGRTQSIILHLEHPAWSQYETSHPTAA